MPRSILDNPFDDPPERRMATIIAKWWPGRYLLVSTIPVGGEIQSTTQRLLSALRTGTNFKDAPPLPETFLTQVVRCDKYGIAASWDNPLFQKEYATLEEAKIGHQQTVARFS